MIHELYRRLAFARDHRHAQRRMSRYLDGDLSGDAAERIDDHVAVCPQCRHLLRTLRRTVEALRGLGRPHRSGLSETVIERLPP